MQRHTDYVTNQHGDPIFGASVLVLDHGTTNPSALFADNGTTPKSNPVLTDALGQFWFYAADGRYDMRISGPNLAQVVLADLLLEDPLDGSDANFHNVTANSLVLANPLLEASGGTGETFYGNGQLLIGDSSGGLTKNTLTAGVGVIITNGSGSITISSPTVGTVTSVDVSGGTTGLTTSGGPITSSGVITISGTLIANNGGTGFATYTIGDILFANTTTTLAKLADVATGNAIISGGVGAAPSYGKIGLTTHVTGTLPIGNGGTGTSFANFVIGDILYADTTSTLARLADAAAGNALITGGAGAPPSYGKIGLTTHVSGILPIANGGTGTVNGVNGGIF